MSVLRSSFVLTAPARDRCLDALANFIECLLRTGNAFLIAVVEHSARVLIGDTFIVISGLRVQRLHRVRSPVAQVRTIPGRESRQYLIATFSVIFFVGEAANKGVQTRLVDQEKSIRKLVELGNSIFIHHWLL